MTIRVVVAEDSPTTRRYLVACLAAEPDIEVVGEASDGGDAVALAQRLKPDVLVLDIVMPGLDGVRVTEEIMAACPLPVLIVSSGGPAAQQAFDVLAAGAIEVLPKPKGIDDLAWNQRFITSVRMIARIRVITHVRGALRHRPMAAASAKAPLPPPRAPQPPPPTVMPEVVPALPICARRIIAIGASTGGPRIISSILSQLPASFPWPILVVLHVGEGFDVGWRDWLAAQCALPVEIVQQPQQLHASGRGRILLAPPGSHLVVDGNTAKLDQAPERNSCRPSVDVLFESLCPQADSVVACLLTGMGRDGARGLLALRQAGAVTIAQDEATSIVYGMPQEAARLGAVQWVLPASAIAARLMACATTD